MKNQVSEYCTNCDAVISRLDCNCPSGPSYCFEFSPSIHYIHGAVREWCDDPTRAESKYGHISNWNTNGITDMSRLFSHCSEFNENINNWDVSSVTDMTDLFEMASSFNQPLDSWDVSSVRNMEGTFNDAYSFNQPLNSWDVSSVTNMDGLFHNAMMFNQPLDSWDVSSVTNMDQMFEGSSFNQCLDVWKDKVPDHCYGCHDVIRISCNRDDIGNNNDDTSSIIKLGGSYAFSYNDGRVRCEQIGYGLCSKGQLCPSDVPYNGIGVSGSTDTWVPVNDGSDEWLQFGEHASPRCLLHSIQYSPDPHPCHTHPDPEKYPDEPSCEHSQLYCCEPPRDDRSSSETPSDDRSSSEAPSDDRSSNSPVIVLIVVVVASVIVFIGIIWYYSYSKFHRRNHPFAVVQEQPEELQLPRAEVQLSTIPMAQVDTNVKLNSFCGNCGSPLNADSKKFCVKCGAAITDIECINE